MAGKGSRPRPLSVTSEVFNDNWDRIFGNKDGGQTDKVQPKHSEKS